jgi:hypothetical protein
MYGGLTAVVILSVIPFILTSSIWKAALLPTSPTVISDPKSSYQTSNQSRIPAEFKHITRRRKRN